MAEKQLLIESCDFSFSVKENNELKESLRLSAGKNDTLIVKGIPSTICNFKNQNGRIYPTALMRKAIEEAKPKMNRRELNSQAREHPESSLVTPINVSHTIINAYIKNVEVEVDGKKVRHDVLFTDWLVLPTRDGTTLMTLLKNGVSVPVSIRGLGSCDENGIVDDYEFLGVDCVANASSKVHSTMYVSESVEVSAAPLTETYVVSASATNVVRDLDSALALSQQIDSANFGTVKKTSTKLDSEVDPKTGAETTMVTLETETEDEVSELDQALMMAKQAMMNGKADIDSVTIENIKEEQPKESAENSDVPVLNEENKITEDHFAPLPHITPITNHILLNYPKESKAYKVALRIQNDLINNRLEDRQAALEELKKYVDVTEDEYVPESVVTEAGVDKLMDEIRSIMYNEGLSLEQACRKYCEYHENIPYEYVLEYMRTNPVIESITEAKEEKQEDQNEGKQYVLKTNQGFVAMNGNAISFVDNPKEAIHFIKGKEESGVIHLSGINKILETMGIYDIQKYFKKGTTDISAPNDINIQNAKNAGIEVKECGNIDMPMTEDNGSNTRFKATVKIADESGESSEDIPVSAIDMEGINAEISNLYDMKKQKGNPVITVTDTTSGQQFAYNPESRQIELMNIQTEASGDLEQNGNKLSMEIDDNNKVEKEFNSPEQAAVAKAGIETGKLGGDVLLSEDDEDDDEDSDTAKCAWCGEEFEKSALRKEKDLGYLCNTCAKGIQSREGSLTFEEEVNGPNYEDIEPGWYAGAQNIGVTGPYESKEALLADLGEVADKIDIEYISPEDLGLAAESSKIDEVLYNKPSKASDPLIKTPLEEDDESPAVNIVFKNIDWNTKDFMNSMMANMENDDPVNIEDIKSKVKDLPDEATITVKVNEIPLSDDSLLEKFLFDKLSEKYAMKVNNAEMANISWAV